MSGLRIALYCPNKPLTHPVPSGDQTIARGLQRALQGWGHDCREAATFRSRWFWHSPRGWRQAASSLLQSLELSRRWRPRIWLTYHGYYKSPDLIGPLVAARRGIPYVLFQPMFATKRRRDPTARIGFYLNRLALARADHAFTNNLMDLAALGRSLPRERITYLPPGIFPEDFACARHPELDPALRSRHGIAAATPLLLAVAQLRADVKFQSLLYLFRALSLIRSTTAFQLLLVGDGPMRRAVAAAADQHLPGRVMVVGGVAREQLGSYYEAADLFVFPGLGESLGMVYLEAQACGCPVVAVHSRGTAQVIESGATGILTAPGDIDQFARAVRDLLLDPARRRAMGEAGRRFVMERRNLRINYQPLAVRLEDLAGGSR
ncbi:MAG: glycosyl transferase family 1 [Syntrophobacteraceae bacterium CG07_land_8_20_14_0_80_61_8]|nr:MAG: glycosyl transferase family 1 [Syntrophobacteraceae bacterium CG07_land_8_20_14_0_80_61_8]